MGVAILGLKETETMLYDFESTARRRSVRLLREAAEKMQTIAQQMAPIDDGELESAIKVDVSAAKDDRGRFQRRSVTVYIDMGMAASTHGKQPRSVGDYAYFVHEHVTPYGPEKLGPRSQEKQLSTLYQVGGGFLDRAAEEIEDAYFESVSSMIADLL
jgi:hypothetical protein